MCNNDLGFRPPADSCRVPVERGRIIRPAYERTAHPDSRREYTRMNTTYAKPSNNLADFAPIRFQE